MTTIYRADCRVDLSDSFVIWENVSGRYSFIATENGTASAAILTRSDVLDMVKTLAEFLGVEALKAERARPNGPQKYRGAGNHEWEPVVPAEDAPSLSDVTVRLRVPGGWLYRVGQGTPTFVPMPEAVGYEV